MPVSPGNDPIDAKLNLDTHRVEFLAHYASPPIKGSIDVDHLRQLIGHFEYADELLDEFRERHIAFTAAARLKHATGEAEPDGTVFLTRTDMMP
jgi:hypothetical protein